MEKIIFYLLIIALFFFSIFLHIKNRNKKCKNTKKNNCSISSSLKIGRIFIFSITIICLVLILIFKKNF